jgi:hypothetical protein
LVNLQKAGHEIILPESPLDRLICLLQLPTAFL